MVDEIQFGSKKISYSLEFTNRKTLGIGVTPEMNVVVKAPNEASLEKIRAIVRKRAPWILKQQDFFLSFHPKSPPKKFVSGETHLYLGKGYRLKVTQGKKNQVKLRRPFIEVQCRNRKRVKALLNQWYLQQASIKLGEIAQPWIERFKRYNVSPSSIRLRQMKNRWGSCTAKEKIILNPELIRAPKRCIEYVIVHELCHLVERDHTQKFFCLQKKMTPDWEKWKMKLEKMLS